MWVDSRRQLGLIILEGKRYKRPGCVGLCKLINTDIDFVHALCSFALTQTPNSYRVPSTSVSRTGMESTGKGTY